MHRLLVTTAIKETWGDSEPILFLGKWCNYKNINIPRDYVICEPFAIQPKKKKEDFKFIIKTEKKLLSQLIKKLNIVHKISYSKRQWNILLGHWLRRFVSVSFNRYFSISEALENYEVKSTKKINLDSYDFSTKDSLSFVLACDNDLWNHFFYLKVLDFLDFKNIKNVDIGIQNKLSFLYSNANLGKFSNLKNVLQNKLSSIFTKDNDAFLVGTYLPRKIEFQLHYELGQAPQIWPHEDVFDIQTNFKLRKNFLDDDGYEGFEKFIRKIIGDFLPRVFLENFKNYHQKTNYLSWPKNPKFIYTSNNYDFDEVFKFWVADKIENNVPYYIGQHGSGYGTHRYFQTLNSPEVFCSDNFLSWGFNNSSKKIKPAFIFTISDKSFGFKKNGGLLIILASPLHRFCHWDNYFEFQLYISKQFELLKHLSPKIFNQLLLRLHPQHATFFPDAIEEFRLEFPCLNIEPGAVKIRKLISKSRLVVHAYDSSGLLETLSSNIPTLGFFPDGYDHLLPKAKQHYKNLEDAGIIYRSPKLLSQKIEIIWDQINEWWESENVQDAKNNFCMHYALNTLSPAKDLKKILLTLK